MMSLGAESTINPPSLGKAYLLFISVYFNLAPASLRPERARRSGSAGQRPHYFLQRYEKSHKNGRIEKN